MAKTNDVLEVEIAGLREATAERVKMYDDKIDSLNTRIRSVHDTVTELRTLAGDNRVVITSLEGRIKGLNTQVSDLTRDFDSYDEKMDARIDKIKEGQAQWITEVSTKVWRAAAVIIPLVLGVLALVLK